MAKKPPAFGLRVAKDAEAFVALDDARPSSGLAVQPVSPPKGRKTVRRADGRELRKQTVYLEAALARRLAVFCAAEGRELSEVVGEAVEHLLDSAAGGRP